jgi:hypothetical protein
MPFEKIKKHAYEILSEPGGSLSWGRCASTVSLLASIAWVSHLIIHTGQLPALDGITGFVIGPYGANKLGTAVQSFSQNPAVPNPNQTPSPMGGGTATTSVSIITPPVAKTDGSE